MFQGAVRNDGQIDGSGVGGSGQRSDTNNRASNQRDVQDGNETLTTIWLLINYGRTDFLLKKLDDETFMLDFSNK